MLWKMLGLEHSDWVGLKNHPVNDVMVSEDPDTKEKTWYPPLAAAKSNHPLNKAFMTDWTAQVYAEEKVSIEHAHQSQRRTSDNYTQSLRDNKASRVPDRSFSKEVITECVKTYYRHILGELNKEKTEEGTIKRELKKKVDRRRGRRSGVSKSIIHFA